MRACVHTFGSMGIFNHVAGSCQAEQLTIYCHTVREVHKHLLATRVIIMPSPYGHLHLLTTGPYSFGMAAQPLFATDDDHLLRRVALQELQATLWMFATFEHRPQESVLAAAATHMSKVLGEFQLQSLGLSLFAFANMGFYPHPAILTAAAARAVELLPVSVSMGVAAGACV